MEYSDDDLDDTMDYYGRYKEGEKNYFSKVFFYMDSLLN